VLFWVPSTGGFKRKPYSSLVLKILSKKSAKKENSGLFMNSILYNGKMRVENQKKAPVYAQESRLKMPLKNSISGPFYARTTMTSTWQMRTTFWRNFWDYRGKILR
jgi:hypothetical protein